MKIETALLTPLGDAHDDIISSMTKRYPIFETCKNCNNVYFLVNNFSCHSTACIKGLRIDPFGKLIFHQIDQLFWFSYGSQCSYLHLILHSLHVLLRLFSSCSAILYQRVLSGLLPERWLIHDQWILPQWRKLATLTSLSQPNPLTTQSIPSRSSSPQISLRLPWMNRVSETSTLESGLSPVIPIKCSCSGQYYQVSASSSYRIGQGETHYSIANIVYQGG